LLHAWQWNGPERHSNKWRGRLRSSVASIEAGRAFARPLIHQNNIHSKEEEQEEPKSLPPDAFPGLQICQNCFCDRLRSDEVTAMSLVAPFLGHGVLTYCVTI